MGKGYWKTKKTKRDRKKGQEKDMEKSRRRAFASRAKNKKKYS